MKIAIITPTLHYGGGERQVEFLALGLKSKGYSVTVYCFADEGEIADILRAGGVKVVGLYSRLLSKFSAIGNKEGPVIYSGIFKKNGVFLDKAGRMLNELYSALRLFFIFLAEKPSVAHLYQNQTKMAILAAKAAGVKKIVYTETSIIGDWLTPAQISIMRSLWRLCDAIVTLSEAMRSQMIKLKAADAGKIYLIPTMLSLSGDIRISPEDGCKKETINVGIIGRLTPEKGHIFFLRAASSITKARRGINFIIAGNGYLKDELMAAARTLVLDENVEFTGPFENISDLMRRIDILVLSSLTEGLPLVLLEGMAHGKPIVATNVGGVPELVINGRTGFVVAPRDPQALADAIMLLADDPQKRKVFADEAISRFRERYSSEIVIPMIESVYCGSKN